MSLYTIAAECPDGMVYQDCGPLCPQTCENKDVDCPGGCAPGCFCPYKQYLLNGVCVDEEVCTGNNIITRFTRWNNYFMAKFAVATASHSNLLEICLSLRVWW